MNWWQNLKTVYKNAAQRINIKAILRSPIAHIIGINTAMFVQNYINAGIMENQRGAPIIPCSSFHL